MSEVNRKRSDPIQGRSVRKVFYLLRGHNHLSIAKWGWNKNSATTATTFRERERASRVGDKFLAINKWPWLVVQLKYFSLSPVLLLLLDNTAHQLCDGPRARPKQIHEFNGTAINISSTLDGVASHDHTEPPRE